MSHQLNTSSPAGRRRPLLNSAAMAGLVVALGAPLAAQAQTPAAPGPSADNSVVADIVVTASRREERLQDVPLAVTAIPEQQFVKSNFSNPTDLQYLSPSVQTSRSGGQGFNIRGVGTNSFNAATEQTVGLVVDGVVQGFVDDVTGDLSDVQMIEVLRGPQGTQFGKNASAGVVNITTHKPTFDKLGVVARASYGSYNDTRDSLRVNVPLSPTLAAMVVASYQNRDGWAYNVVRKERSGDSNQWGIKGKLLWEPNDRFSAYFLVDYRRFVLSPDYPQTYQSIGFGQGATPPGFGLLNTSVVPSYTNTNTSITTDAFRINKAGGESLELNYKLGDFKLTSVTAFRTQRFRNRSNIGGAPIAYATPDRNTGNRGKRGDQLSQEIRLASPSTSRVQFVAGGYFYRRASVDNVLIAGPLARVDGLTYSISGGEDDTSYKVKSIAGFVDGTVDLLPKLKLVAGGRVTHDKASAKIVTIPVPGVIPLNGRINGPGASQVSNSNFSYRIGPKYDFTPDIMGYATVARGYKGPLAVPVPGSGARVVDAETVQSYEAGIKSALFERRVTLNVSVFDQKFKNFQTTVLDLTVTPPFVLGNAGGLRTTGIEAEMSAKVARGLTLNGALTYQDAKFTDFKGSCPNNREPIKLPVSTDPNAVRACVTIPGQPSFVQARGFPIPNASKWNVTSSVQYETPLSDKLTFDANANYLYRSDFFSSGVDPNTRVKGYGIVNVNVGIGAENGAWRVGLFARNLFNKYYLSAVDGGAQDAGAIFNILNPDAKRTVGIQLDGRF